MTGGILSAILFAAAAAGPDARAAYIHPGVGFGVAVPDGWQEATYPNGVRFSRGGSTIHVALREGAGASGDALVEKLIAALPRGSRVADRSERHAALDGARARHVVLDVDGPAGRGSQVHLVFAPVREGLFVIGGDFPAADAARDAAAFDGALRSFRREAPDPMALLRRAKPPVVPPPGPVPLPPLPPGSYTTTALGFACTPPPEKAWTRSEDYVSRQVRWSARNDSGTIQVRRLDGQAATRLSDLARAWEADTLRKGGPLEQRIGENESVLNGMPLFVAAYEGRELRAKAVWLRSGEQTFWLLAAFRREQIGDGIDHFDALVKSFRVTARPAGPTDPRPAAPTAPPATTEAAEGDWQVYRKAGLGFSVGHPREMAPSSPRPTGVIFSARDGSELSPLAVTFQALPAEGTTLDQEVEAYRAQARKDHADALLTDAAPVSLPGGLAGKQFLCEFVAAEAFIRQQIAVVQDKAGRRYVLAAVGPRGKLIRHRAVVTRMFESLTPAAD